MRTIEYKSEYKQKENSIETLEIYVPLAYLIGAYRIKSELEDISFKCLLPEKYEEIKYAMLKNSVEYNKILNEMFFTIDSLLTDKLIPHQLKIRTKNYYSIYKKLTRGVKMCDIHDLLALKIMVDNIQNCYLTLGYVHSKYNPINSKIKDYLYNPKTNMYRSLHTTVFGPNDTLVQTQIRTFEMDKVASFGISTYWNIRKGNTRDEMQKVLRSKFQFVSSLMYINDRFPDNFQFVESVKKEIFSDKVYVYNSKGDIVELPFGSTIIDYAYKLGVDYGHKFFKATVNNKEVSMDYVLKNNDRIIVFVDNLSKGPKKEWIRCAKTSYAKEKIKEYKS